MAASGALLIEFEGGVQRAYRQFDVLFVDHHRGLDLAGGDHLDVDALLAERAEFWWPAYGASCL